MQVSQSNIDDITVSKDIARLFKFYVQFKNPYLQFAIPYKKIPYKSLYQKYKKEFDTLANVFQKYKLDPFLYVKFFVNVLDYRECDIKSQFANINTITKYAEWLKHLNKLDNIYKYFVKSAKNIANECNNLGYSTTKDFIRYLITEKKLAEYYISGKISLYYFAAIPNFKKIIPKLDSFSKAEFHKIYDRFEMYNNEITSAFLRKTNQKVNPIKYTDELIYQSKLSNNV